MNLILYNNSAEQNRVNKNLYLSEIVHLNGTLRNQSSIVNPTITIELNPQVIEQKILRQEYIVKSFPTDYVVDSTPSRMVYDFISKVLSANYARITEFNRYYFITDITSIRNNLWEISMTCDVLMSYKTEILNLPAFIMRNQFKYNELLEDKRYPLFYDKLVDEYSINQINSMFDVSGYWNNRILMTAITNLPEDYENVIYNPDNSVLSSVSKSQIPNKLQYRSYILRDLNTFLRLQEYLYSHENLVSGVVSVIIFPYDLQPSFVDVPEVISILGDSMDSQFYGFFVSDNSGGGMIVSSNEFTINGKYNNFLDYSPYSLYELYVPYFGWIELDYKMIKGCNLKITYTINVQNGSSMVYLTDETNDKLIDAKECQLGVSTGFTKTNVQQIEDTRLLAQNNIVTSAISSGGNIISGAAAGALIGGPAGAAAGAIAGGVSFLTGTINSLLNYQATMDTQHIRAQCFISSGELGQWAPQELRVRITYPRKVLENDTEYLKLNGKPLLETGIVRDYSGYTEIGGIHLENLPTATKVETDRMVDVLSQGIIL